MNIHCWQKKLVQLIYQNKNRKVENQYSDDDKLKVDGSVESIIKWSRQIKYKNQLIKLGI